MTRRTLLFVLLFALAVCAASVRGEPAVSFELQAQQPEPGRWSFIAPIDGERRTVELRTFDLRANSFAITFIDDNGESAADPGPTRAVRGTIDGMPGSIVAGGFDLDGGLSVMITTGGNNDLLYEMTPGDDGLHNVRHMTSLDLSGECGVGPGELVGDVGDGASPGVFFRNANLRIAEIAFDTDVQLYNLLTNPGDSQTVATQKITAAVEALLAAVTVIYERDALITYELTSILIRSTPAADVYTGTVPGANGGLLGQLRNEWRANQTSIPRDVAHLLSGRDFSGTTIGVAWVGTVCGDFGYGVNQWIGNFNSRVALVSHELGHNWSANHCNNNGECRIMCAGLGGCNGIGNPVRFGPASIASIINHRNSRGCLSAPPALPLEEDFESRAANPEVWEEDTSLVVRPEPNAPSPVFVGSINANALVQTVPFTPANEERTELALGFTARPQFIDVGEDLIIEHRITGVWLPLARLTSFDSVVGDYTRYTFAIPAASSESQEIDRAVRFRTEFGTAGRFWDIDDVIVAASGDPRIPVPLPFADDFELRALALERWSRVGGAFINSSTPIDGAASLRLTASRSVVTVPLLAFEPDQRPLTVSFDARSSANATSLAIDVIDNAGRATQVAAVPPTATAVERGIEVDVPVELIEPGILIRLRLNGTLGEWNVDSLTVDFASVSACPPDQNGDGLLDIDDFSSFVANFFANDPLADVNADSLLDIDDFSSFVTQFFTPPAGCLQ
ncbi:MAG: M12 family metallo-peptidase [Planctomycetota bacterium]